MLSVSSGTCVSDGVSSGLVVSSAEASVWLSVCVGAVVSAGASGFLPQADIIIVPAARSITRSYTCLFFIMMIPLFYKDL